DGLSKPDYYTENKKVVGSWHGKASAHMNLHGEVTKEEFAKLCKNIHPSEKQQLTVRNSENRTVLYDFTFSVPKSVSIQYSISQDNEILLAMEHSVQKTMKEIEQNAETRVRINGKNEN